jgi:hypothetical protein
LIPADERARADAMLAELAQIGPSQLNQHEPLILGRRDS